MCSAVTLVTLFNLVKIHSMVSESCRVFSASEACPSTLARDAKRSFKAATKRQVCGSTLYAVKLIIAPSALIFSADSFSSLCVWSNLSAALAPIKAGERGCVQ